MIVRPAQPSDLSALAAIQSRSPEAAQWTPEAGETVVAEVEGAVVAFLVSRAVAGEAEILNLAVDPAFRRRGAASTLVRSLDSEVVFLEVRESNQAAIRLYANLGFQQQGSRPNYYTDPPDNALVMALKRTLGSVKVGVSRADQHKA